MEGGTRQVTASPRSIVAERLSHKTGLKQLKKKMKTKLNKKINFLKQLKLIKVVKKKP